MKRSKVKALKDVVWFKPIDSDPLEVALMASGAWVILDGMMNPNTDPESKIRRVCSRAFVDFRGYFEDDEQTMPVPNSLAARIEIYQTAIRPAIEAKLLELASGVIEGKDDAAFD